MKLFFAFLFISSFVASCTSGPKNVNNEKEVTKKPKPMYHKPSSGFTDTLKIISTAAIFFSPDSLQWQKLKSVNDTMAYASFEHDCFYQMRNARNVIKQYFPNVKIIDALKVRYLSFTRINGTSQYIDLDSIADPCGVLLFDKKKEPHPADMMNIDTELGFYFKQ